MFYWHLLAALLSALTTPVNSVFYPGPKYTMHCLLLIASETAVTVYMIFLFSSGAKWLSNFKCGFLQLSKRLSANGFSTMDDKFSVMVN